MPLDKPASALPKVVDGDSPLPWFMTVDVTGQGLVDVSFAGSTIDVTVKYRWLKETCYQRRHARWHGAALVLNLLDFQHGGYNNQGLYAARGAGGRLQKPTYCEK